MTYTWIFLADNHPRSGNFANWVEGAHIGGPPDLELCSLEGEGLPVERGLAARPRWVSVAGRRYPIRSYRPWVGNWCWTGYLLHARHAARLLQRLRSVGGYDPDSAPTGFWGAWRGRRPITPHLVLAYGGSFENVFTRRNACFEPRVRRDPARHRRRAVLGRRGLHLRVHHRLDPRGRLRVCQPRRPGWLRALSPTGGYVRV